MVKKNLKEHFTVTYTAKKTFCTNKNYAAIELIRWRSKNVGVEEITFHSMGGPVYADLNFSQQEF